MTFQAYLDTIKAKTGKTPADFARLAAQRGLATRADLMAWLKADFGLGHGHANVIAHLITQAGQPPMSASAKLDQHFAGPKAAWHQPYDKLLAKLARFGGEFRVAPTKSYLSLLRGDKKFGLLAVTAQRLDVGLKLKGVPPAGRLEAAGDWNAMVTHRVRVADPRELDAELLAWLKQAYQAA